MAQRISQFFEQYVKGIYFPELRFTDILEILIITFLIYQIMVWIKNTKAWMLMRGILALAGFILVAAILQMHTILWLAKEAASSYGCGRQWSSFSPNFDEVWRSWAKNRC